VELCILPWLIFWWLKIPVMFVTGRNGGKTVTNETVTSEVGGASTHATKSGVAHYFYQWCGMSGRFETLVELFTTKQ
jgi:hypothetical protein